MNFAIIFMAVAASAVLTGFIARWIAAHLVSDQAAPIAGFSFVLGGGSIISIGMPAELGSHLDKLASASGTIVGLVVLWYLFFKRKTATS